MKMYVFKTAQQVNIHLGFFCKKICHQESPNLVTLLIPHEAFAQPPPPPKQETRKTNKNCSSIFQTSASRPKKFIQVWKPFLCVSNWIKREDSHSVFLSFNKKNGPSLSFSFIFQLFKQTLKFLQQINVKHDPSSMPYRDMNLRPLER